MSATAPPEIEIPKALQPIGSTGRMRSFPTFRSVFALMLREMGQKYGKSPGGYLWALASPMIFIMVMTIAFSLLARTPPIGKTFIMFYASGFLVFSIFNQLAGPVSGALTFNKSLLQFPTVTWIDSIIARFLLNFLTALIVYFILLYAIAFFSPESPRFDVPLMLEAVVLAGGISLAWGVFTCYLFAELPVLGDFWKFASRPLFIASGVLFMYEDFPESVQNILYWNPLMHVVSLGRAAVYPRYDAAFVSTTYVMLFIMLLLVPGLLLVRQHHDRLLNRGK
ncbi:ABC transporter permease [Maritimibacter dapengensis]|uniref:Transport permease protein n=1 Tax=Maritimibacter dapengensis TaxID=2836868 RepID=A0ABS6T4L0_9RHOB|nr:ABC transporter permease [Maritimibacter dapengensis]MBV7380181.1 ABC transporter permease [Maritimibacter dapengensis]